MAWFFLVTSAFVWQAATVPVTDYDADYLYSSSKIDAKLIPLSSFYKLEESNRGAWQLHYHNKQGGPHKLTIQPLGSGDDSRIYGFTDAIWQHNPQLDVRYDWWFR